MNKTIVTGLMTIVVFCAFKGSIPAGIEIPRHWPAPVYDLKTNPVSPAKAALGRKLFYDPALSRNHTISCASCHSPYTAFAHVDHDLSHGIDDRIGKRNAPALMNLAWQRQFMWDGAIRHLDMQSLAPITHPDEMGEELRHLIAKLQDSSGYPGLFYEAWKDSTITGKRLLKSLSQFMLTLVSADAKYDRVQRKEDSFSTQEANGYRLFGQHCATCHREPLFTDGGFANNGLRPDTSLNDLGRYGITGNRADSFKFKVPTLRNIEFSFPYMHDGRFRTIREVLNHYAGEKYGSGTLDPRMTGIPLLNDREKTDLIAFLLTLTDRKFLFNPDHRIPRKHYSPVPKEAP